VSATGRRVELTMMAFTFVIAMLMYACADALPVSPTAHRAMEFLIELLG
jgi:hypothetical protein